MEQYFNRLVETLHTEEERKRQLYLTNFKEISLNAAHKATKVKTDIENNKAAIMKLQKIDKHVDLSIKHRGQWAAWMKSLGKLVEDVTLIAIAMDYSDEYDYHHKINMLFDHDRLALIAAEQKMADKYIIMDWLKM